MTAAEQLRDFGLLVQPKVRTFERVSIKGRENDHAMGFDNVVSPTILDNRVWFLDGDLDRDRGLKDGMPFSRRDKHSKDAGELKVAIYTDLLDLLRAEQDISDHVLEQELPQLIEAISETSEFWRTAWTLHWASDSGRMNYTAGVLWTATGFKPGVRDPKKKKVRKKLIAASSPNDILGRRNNGRLPLIFSSVQDALKDLQIAARGIGHAYRARQLGTAIYFDQCMMLLELVERAAEQATISPTICGSESTSEIRETVVERLGFFIQELNALPLPRPFTNLKARWVYDFEMAMRALLENDLRGAREDFDRVARSCKGFREFRMPIEDPRMTMSRMPESCSLPEATVPEFSGLIQDLRKELMKPIAPGRKFDFDFEGRYVQEVDDDLERIQQAVDTGATVADLKELFRETCAHF